MPAYSPKSLIPFWFPSSITSAWPSISKQLGSLRFILAEVLTFCVSMFASTDLLVECRVPLDVVRDIEQSSVHVSKTFSRSTFHPVMGLCRILLSTLIGLIWPAAGFTIICWLRSIPL